MTKARRTTIAAILVLGLFPALALAAEPGSPEAGAAPPAVRAEDAEVKTGAAPAPADSVGPSPEVRERELKAKVESHPGDVIPIMELGKFYYNQGDRSRAEKQFRRVLEINPRQVGALVQLGTVLNELGKSEDALAEFDAALAIDPQRADILCRKGQALYALKRYEDAVRLYLQAKKMDPKDQAPPYWLGIAFADAGIYREALNEWAEVVGLGQDTELGRAAAEGMEVLRPLIGNAP